MTEAKAKTEFLCGECNSNVAEADEFCPSCGSLFVEDTPCLNHASVPAAGVCIVCCGAFCTECGKRSSGMFLCEEHQRYEIYEGMARVYGNNNEAMSQYLCECLKQEGLYAIMFSRKTSPVIFGGPGYTMFNAAGDYLGRIINEFKVMVPCQQAVLAEKLIAEILEHDVNHPDTDGTSDVAESPPAIAERRHGNPSDDFSSGDRHPSVDVKPPR